MTESEMKRLQCLKVVGPDMKHFLSQGSVTRPSWTQLKALSCSISQTYTTRCSFLKCVWFIGCMIRMQRQQPSFCVHGLLPSPRDSEVSLHLKYTLKEKDSA